MDNEVSNEQDNKPGSKHCLPDGHLWLAYFYQGGKLAYWQCEQCGLTDREIEQLPERLGDPSSTHFGVPIPGLDEAHSYVELDENDKVLRAYEPEREQPWQYTYHYWLIRYQVTGDELVRFESHCFEESTFDIPFAQSPKQKTVIAGLIIESVV